MSHPSQISGNRQTDPHQHDHTYQGSAAVSASTGAFEIRRELMSHYMGHAAHAFPRVGLAAPEATLTFLDKWNKNRGSESQLFNALAESAPELAIHLSRYGLPALAVEAVGAVGKGLESGLPSNEELVNQFLNGEINARQFDRMMEARAVADIIQAPGKAMHWVEENAAASIKKGKELGIRAWQATQSHVRSWLGKVIPAANAASPFEDVDQALINYGFVDHVRKTRQEQDLSDQEAACYIIAARSEFAEMCRIDENGRVSISRSEIPPAAATSYGQSLKAELEQARPRLVEQLSGTSCEPTAPCLFAGLQQKVSSLEARIASGQRLDAEHIAQLEEVTEEFAAWQQQQEMQVRRQAQQVHAFRVSEAAFAALAELQQQQAADTADRMQSNAMYNQREREDQRRTWLEIMSNRVTLAEWVNTESLKTLEGLRDTLTEFKRKDGTYQGKSNQLQERIDHNRKEQDKEVKKKRKRRGLGKVLGGISSALKLGAVVTAPVPVVSAAFSAGAAASGAGASAVGNQNAKAQGKIGELEHEIQKDLYGQEQLRQEQYRLNTEVSQLLNDIIEDKYGTPPWVRRAALKEKIARLDEQLAKEPPKDKDSAEYLIWKEHQDELQKAKKKAEEDLHHQDEVAHISDRSWRVADYWGNVWSSDDKRTRRFANALEEAVDSYFAATTKERWAIAQTLYAFEMLGSVTGCSWLSQGAFMGQQAYFLLDMGRYAYTTAVPNIFDAWNAPTKFFGTLGGLSTILSAYLVPAVNTVTAAVMLYRTMMNGQTGTSPQEQMIHHLNSQLNALYETLGNLSKYIGQCNQALKEEIIECRKTVEKSQLALQNDLKMGFQDLRQQQQQQEYRQVVRDIENRSLELQRYTGKENAEDLSHGINVSTNLVCSGGLKSLRGSDMNTLAFTRMISKNPELFSGLLIFLQTGSVQEVPNLRDFFRNVQAYMAIINKAQGLEEKVDKVRSRLMEQGRLLCGFYSSFPKLCEEASSRQKITLSQIEKQIETTLRAERTFRHTLLQSNFEGLIERYKERRVGASRYGLSIAFANQRKDQVQMPPREALLLAGKEKLPRLKDFTKTVGVGTPVMLLGTNTYVAAGVGIAAAVSAPISLPVVATAAGVASVLSLFGIGGMIAERMSRISEYGRLEKVVGTGLEARIRKYDPRVPIPLSEREKRTLSSAITFSKDAGILTVDVVAGRTLRHLSAVRAVYDPYEGGISAQELWKSEVPGTRVMQLRFFFDDYRDNVHCEVKFPETVPVSEEERNRIPESYPVGSIMEDAVQVYQQWLCSDPQENMSFNGITRSSVEPAPCEDGRSIPIAIPSNIVPSIHLESRRLASKGLIMSPRYKFTYSQKQQGFVYSINWGVYDRNKYLGDRAEVVLGVFDERTVKSFGSVVIDETGLSQAPPHIDEFHLNVLFGSALKDELGLPGKDTVTISDGDVIAPVDQPFPGLLKLLETHKRQVRYHSSTYDGNVDNILGPPLEVNWMPIPGIEASLDPKISKSYKKYCRSRHIVTAVGTTIIDRKPKLVRAFLERAGIMLSDQGNEEDLIGFAALHPNGGKVKLLTGQMAEKFVATSTFSQEYVKLLASMLVLEVSGPSGK